MSPYDANRVANTLNQSGRPAALVFNKVGENLYRLGSSGQYYGLLKKAGKQFRRSRKTTKRPTASSRSVAWPKLRKQIGKVSC